MRLLLLQKTGGQRLLKVDNTLYNRMGGDEKSIQEHVDLSQTERPGWEESKALVNLLECCDDYPFDLIDGQG